MARDFHGVCAYCEGLPDEETVDHFRPQSRFPDLTLHWLNLVYACRRCNQAKRDSWPGYDDVWTDRLLKAENPGYVPVYEYVNPNASGSSRPASEFFDYHIGTGQIKPAEELAPSDWSMARRTILDIDLNDSGLGDNDLGHLWNLRLDQRDRLVQRINEVEDPDLRAGILLEFMLPNRPFSSFIAAYIAALGASLAPP